jgi:hypothetical protein
VRALTALACAALTTAALVAPAAAEAARTTVTISSRVPAFNGSVHSSARACEARRRVRVYRRTSAGKRLVGGDRSSGRGRWRVPAHPLQPGAYFARAKRKQAGSVTCRAGRSDVVVIE